MTRTPTPALTTVTATLLLTASCAAPEPVDLGPLLDEVREELGAPGAILAVRYPDGTIDRHAAGVADLDSRRPVDVADAYPLGSISKPLTAAVVFRLAEERRLDLDDPLSRFLPDFPRAGEITVRNLLRQTSGLKDFYLWMYFRPDREAMLEAVTREWTQDELIELAGRFGHHFDPGQDWDYSNANYFLLGVVVERAAGMKLTEAYRHYVFDPLGMHSSWLVLHEPDRDELPLTGHLGHVEGWPHSEMFGELGPSTSLERSSAEWGAGGVVSTADDALRFLHGLLDGELLRPESLTEMLQAVPAASLGAGGTPGLPPDVSNAYTHGLIRTRRPAYEMIGHGGIFAGHTAGLWRLTRCEVDVALYFNRGFVQPRLLLDRVARTVGRHPSVTSACVDGAIEVP